MSYQYLQRSDEPVFGLRFAWGKVKSLYPLHLATMGAMLPLGIVAVIKGGLDLGAFLISIVLNVGMLQVWVPWPSMYSALNGPSWFMCVIVLAYLLFPLLLKRLKALRNMAGALGLLALFVAVHLAASAASYFWMTSGVDTELVKWLTYFFPPVRFCDFGIGCVLGWLFLHVDKSGTMGMDVVLNGAMQALCLALIMASMWAYATELPPFGSPSVRFLLLYSPTTALLIWLVASCTGAVERVWSVGCLRWIADISPYAFLIHNVVLNYVWKAFSLVAGFSSALAIPVALVSLAITLALSAWWGRLVKARKGRR